MKNSSVKTGRKVLSYVVAIAMVISIVSIMSFSSVTAAGVNLLAGTNSDFEAGVGGWGAAVTIVTASPGEGLNSAQVNGWAASWLPGVAPLKDNTNYEVSALVKTIAPGNNLTVGITYNDSTTAGNESATIGYTGNDTSWTRVTKTFSTGTGIALVDQFNKYAVTMWSSAPILVDDIQLVELGAGTPGPTATPTPLPTATPSPTPLPTPTPKPATMVKINPMTDKTLTISGSTTPVKAAFVLSYGTEVIEKVSGSTGLWSVKLKKGLAVGSEVIAFYGVSSKEIKVGASAPMVDSLTTKSVYVTGKTYKAAAVVVKIGSKVINSKASATGAIKVKLTSKLKKGTKVMVSVKYKTMTSKATTVVVK